LKTTEETAMEDEHRLVAERKKKLNDLREMGINPYPTKFKKTHAAKELTEKYSSLNKEEETQDHVIIAGRIVGMRDMGKAAFCHILDSTGKIQAYLRQDNLGDNYAIVKKLDVGDIVGIEGNIFSTKTGEVSIKAKKLTFLTKSLFPFPEKFHGFKDQELRYRMRYLDLIMNPEVKDVFIKRSKTIQAMREFLTGQGFIEV
jgi:lysyl-tRNA synthetase class 2